MTYSRTNLTFKRRDLIRTKGRDIIAASGPFVISDETKPVVARIALGIGREGGRDGR